MTLLKINPDILLVTHSLLGTRVGTVV